MTVRGQVHSVWTPYEKAWLKLAWPRIEIPREAIAYALKRTVRAIQSQASRLKIKRLWNGSPANLEGLKHARKKARETWTGSPEHKEQFRQMLEAWNSSPEHKEQWRQVLKKVHETYLGSPENLEHLRRLHETYLGSPENLEVLKRLQETWVGSPENLEQLRQARKKARAKPTWPEARFYGLVYGQNGLAEEFLAQKCIPTSSCQHTPDGQWRKTLFELDGGGHHMHEDKTEHDLLVDAEYRAMGYRVVRAETSSDLFLRVLQVIEDARRVKP